METVKTILSASRPISWINTAAPFAAGYILSVGSFDWKLIVGFFFFLFPYNLLMYGVNDIFDYESDKNNPRKNSIEGGLAPPRTHRQIWAAIAIFCVPLAAVAFSWGNTASKAWLAFSLFMVVAYSLKGLRFKEIPLIDSFTSSTHFYSPLVYGLLLGGGLTGYWPAIIAFVLWGMASHAFGAIQDIQFDREANIKSVGTVFGAKATAWFCFLLYSAVVVIVALNFQGTMGRLVSCALLLYPVVTASCLKVTDKTAATTNVAWKQFLWINQIVGFTITMAYLTSLPAYTPSLTLVSLVTFVIIASALAIAARNTRQLTK